MPEDNSYLIPNFFYMKDANLNVPAWIRAQAEAYAKVSKRIDANPDRPIDPDKLEVIFSQPDAGWLKTRILINGEESVCFYFSDWNNPLPALTKWLETLIPDGRPWEMREHTFANDCEDEEILFHIQSLSWGKSNLCTFITFNSWTDGCDVEQTSFGVAIIKLEQIIAAFYRPIVR